jgi:hypothetical protein
MSVIASGDSPEKEGTTGVHLPLEEAAESVAEEVAERAERLVDFTPATPTQKVATGILVFGFSGLVLLGWISVLHATQSQLQAEHRVAWTPDPQIQVAPGPPSFFHDGARDELVVRGPVDEGLREELETLISISGTPISPPDPAGRSYWLAIDQLAFVSNEAAARLKLYILLLGGLSGTLGVQLRSIINFIGVTSFQNKLDIVRWWPWYALRPAAGFVFGLMAVLLFEAGLFQAGTATTESLTWGTSARNTCRIRSERVR